MLRQLSDASCLLGKTWGYDDQGVWVDEGCSAGFAVAGIMPPETAAPSPEPAEAAAEPTPAPPARDKPTERIESWGEFEPGDGFLVGRSESGELAIGAYALVRYVNQLPADATFTDHFGNEHDIDTRQDILPHRAMLFFRGWVGNPKLIYTLFVWTVNATDQDALFGVVGYQFARKFSLYGGINGFPGTRSLQGSHPYWLGHDRVMADEFFRPCFSYGVWAQGEITPGALVQRDDRQ
jgi:hypothetical protein